MPVREPMAAHFVDSDDEQSLESRLAALDQRLARIEQLLTARSDSDSHPTAKT